MSKDKTAETPAEEKPEDDQTDKEEAMEEEEEMEKEEEEMEEEQDVMDEEETSEKVKRRKPTTL